MNYDRGHTTGGNLALDFSNTLSWDPDDDTAGEKLTSYRAVLDWACDAGLISDRTVDEFVGTAERDPGAAERGLRLALDLRAAIHGIFSSYARGVGVPPPESLDFLNGLIAKLPLRLEISGSIAEWDLSSRRNDLNSVLWPVIWSAAMLMTSGDLVMVKECAGDGCGWLFLDKSRRHNRKWCVMSDCGNRAKARRHYYRHRK